MDEKAQIKQKKKKLRDRFQYAAFTVHYHINLRGGMENTEAFVKAIAATSDEFTDKVLERYPDAIDRWLKVKKRTQYVKVNSCNDSINTHSVWLHQSDSACGQYGSEIANGCF